MSRDNVTDEGHVHNKTPCRRTEPGGTPRERQRAEAKCEVGVGNQGKPLTRQQHNSTVDAALRQVN